MYRCAGVPRENNEERNKEGKRERERERSDGEREKQVNQMRGRSLGFVCCYNSPRQKLKCVERDKHMNMGTANTVEVERTTTYVCMSFFRGCESAIFEKEEGHTPHSVTEFFRVISKSLCLLGYSDQIPISN